MQIAWLCGYGQDTKQPRMPMQAGKDFKWITTAMAMVALSTRTTTTTNNNSSNNNINCNSNNFNCNLLAASGLRHFLACLTAKFNSCLILSARGGVGKGSGVGGRSSRRGRDEDVLHSSLRRRLWRFRCLLDNVAGGNFMDFQFAARGCLKNF